jgi:Kdo2-lipid IVA lauroyltransferase/acyltransferase
MKIREFLIGSLVKVVSFFPISVIQHFGALVGRAIAGFNDVSMVRVARININLCFPTLKDKDKEVLIKRSVSQSVVTGIEMPYIFMRSAEKVIKNIKKDQGAEDVENALAAGRSVLMVGPHIGSWEMGIIYMAEHFPTSILYSPQKNQILDKIVYESRTRSNLRMLPADSKGIRQVYKTLSSGNEVVVMLTDQVPHNDKSGSYVPFFGVDAKTMSFPTKLYKRHNPAVFLTYCIRIGTGKGFEMRFESLDKYIQEAERIGRVEDTFAHACSMIYEKIILEFPDQYQWVYKRFKHQPQGVEDYYKYR